MKGCITICGLTVLLSVISMQVQAKSTFGGIIFVDSYIYDQDENAKSNGVVQGGVPTKDDSVVSHIELPNISRIRTKWSNEDDVTMYIELGIGGANGETNTRVRHAYGTWDFTESWQIMAGHSSTPFSPLFPSQLIGNNADHSHNIGKGYGEFSSGRFPQVRLTHRLLNKRGAIAVAISDANNSDDRYIPRNWLDNDNPQLFSAADLETLLPRVDVGGAYRFFNMQLFPGVFYQKQEFQNLPGTAVSADDELTAWGVSLGMRGSRGAWIISGEANFGQNWGATRAGFGSSGAGRFARASIDEFGNITDTDNYSYWLDVGYRFNNNTIKSTVHFIVGEMSSEDDGANANREFSYKSRMMGVSVPIDMPWVARGFRVRPELFYYDNGEDDRNSIGIDYGKEIIAGVQLQYTF